VEFLLQKNRGAERPPTKGTSLMKVHNGLGKCQALSPVCFFEAFFSSAQPHTQKLTFSMNVVCPLKRCLRSAQWLNRVQARSLSRKPSYRELVVRDHCSHIQGLFPTKAEAEVEEVCQIRNEIWVDQNGGRGPLLVDYTSLTILD
jgi:hypothetical protein